jgi:serine/threonine protein kinase
MQGSIMVNATFIPFIPEQIQKKDRDRIVENNGLLLSAEEIKKAQQLLSGNRLAKSESKLPFTVVKFEGSDDLYAVYSGKGRILGRGAFGKVKLMQRITGSDPGNFFAIKVIELAERKKTEYDTLLTEAETENAILKELEFGLGGFQRTRTKLGGGKQYVLGMKLVPGTSLSRLLLPARRSKSKVLTFESVMSIIESSLDALLSMQSKKIAHCDLSNSENILYDSISGKVSFVDFGKSRVVKHYSTFHAEDFINPGDSYLIKKILCGLDAFMHPIPNQEIIMGEVKRLIKSLMDGIAAIHQSIDQMSLYPEEFVDVNVASAMNRLNKIKETMVELLKVDTLDQLKQNYEILSNEHRIIIGEIANADLDKTIERLQAIRNNYPNLPLQVDEMVDINSTSIEIPPKTDSVILVNTESKNDLKAIQKAVDVTHDLQNKGVRVEQILYHIPVPETQNINKIAEQINDKDPNKIHIVQHNGKIINDKISSNDRKKVNAFLNKLVKNSLMKLNKNITKIIKSFKFKSKLIGAKTEIYKLLKDAYRAMNQAQPLIQVGGFFNLPKNSKTSSSNLTHKRR